MATYDVQVVERLRAVEALAMGLQIAAADRGQQRPMTLSELDEVIAVCDAAAKALSPDAPEVS